ncbi:MAG: hypothetical protein V1853_00215, partial [bacterium]
MITKGAFALAFISLCIFFIPATAKSAEDKTAPQITAFELTPSQVNTESEDHELTLTITVTDDMTGVFVASTQLKLAP